MKHVLDKAYDKNCKLFHILIQDMISDDYNLALSIPTN